MLKIDHFLDRFKKIEDENKEQKIFIQRAIKDVTGLDVVIKNIDIKKETVYIEVSSLFKSKIILEKNKILERVNFKYKNIIKIK